jgi:BirA family biotin operon repressor/biotin-[acetyl-CoA-carboxylase] ligase
MQEIRIGHITSQWAQNNHLYVDYKPNQASTSASAKDEAFTEKTAEEFLCLYLADHQTAGRGRNTNSWVDASPGSSLLSSWSYLLGTKPQPTTSCLMGLAIYRACSTTWPFLPWNLKAPNDIYIDDRKIAGILLENVAQGDQVRLIVGLGMNFTASPESVETSTCLMEELPHGVPLLGQDYLAFLDRLLFEMTDAASHAEDSLSSTDQVSLLMALNQHPLLAEKYTGIEADGSLLLGETKIHWSSL